MAKAKTNGVWAVLIWSGLIFAILTPIVASAFSPLLAWREPVYIAAGFSGIIAMGLMLAQPLLVTGVLPGLAARRGRHVHLIVGSIIVAAVVLHVGALWITSPPDVVDALLFRSPTPFSIWGVIAMWAIFAAALLAAYRTQLHVRLWRRAHTLLVAIVAVTTVLHVVLIDGTMEDISKIGLCAAVLAALAFAVHRLRVWVLRRV